MTGYSLSVLEISRIIEEAFLPERCVCTTPDGRTLSVQISSKSSLEDGITFVGIPIAGLGSSRAIANLVLEIRSELSSKRLESNKPCLWKAG